MKTVFLDTSGWLAALSPREQRHQPAYAAYRRWLENGVPLVTTNLVVAEMHILVTRARGVAHGLRFLDSLHQDANHDVVFVDQDLELAAINRWLRPYAEHSISLADAVSLEVMRQRRVRQALSLDHHFVVAGFETIPE